MSGEGQPDPAAENADEPRIRDKRKIDPETGEARAEDATASDGTSISDDELAALLTEGERDLVAEYRDRAARAEAELVNFRARVERDRAANRDAVIAEVVRSLLPAIDDLDRAETHGDLADGTPLALIAQKLRTGFDKYGLAKIGEKGEAFDPARHEAIVQLPNADVTVPTVADVIEPGYVLGERLLRAAKVAVHAPAAD